MAGQQSAKVTEQQSIGRAVGLLAACMMVVFGGWIGLRPWTILMRAVVVGITTSFLTGLFIGVVKATRSDDDE